MPCLFTRDRSLSAGPEGFFSPRSHLAHQVWSHIKIVGKNCLAHSLSHSKSPDLFRRERIHRPEAGVVKAAHGLLVDASHLVQCLHRFVDGCQRFTSIFLGHVLLLPQHMPRGL